jgi:polysaccharide export outer membrane protein
MIKNIVRLIILISFPGLVSCVTNRKLTYLQNNNLQSDTTVSVSPSDYKVNPYDNLFIKVVTPDPKWSAMFNSLPVTTTGINVTEQSADMISYPVDGAGTIQIPYAGRIQVVGKTLPEITVQIELALKDYISDASITVKMINNYVSLLGEVKKPGRYPIYKDRLNIFQALAMGGDLTDFSNRQKIQIIRQTDKGTIVKEYSLNDRSILTSEFFYVMPNDVIYAKPMKGKFFQMNSFPYAVLLSTVTTFVLIFNVLK